MLENTIILDSTITNIVKVSEEILHNNIDKFVINKLKEKSTYKKNYKTFYTYLAYTKEYFICSYEYKSIKLHIIDILSKYLESKKFEEKRVLVYFENYFLLFDNSSLYYFQKIEKELLNQDIELYIKKRFIFNYKKFIHIKNADLKSISKKENIKSNLTYVYDTNNLKIYALYLIMLILLSTSFLSFNYYETINNKKNFISKQNKIKLANKKVQKNSLYYKTSYLFSELYKQNLRVSKFDFANNSLSITIISKSRDDFYTFIESYKNTKINSFIKTKDGYEISSTFTF